MQRPKQDIQLDTPFQYPIRSVTHLVDVHTIGSSPVQDDEPTHRRAPNRRPPNPPEPVRQVDGRRTVDHRQPHAPEDALVAPGAVRRAAVEDHVLTGTPRVTKGGA